MRMSLLWAALPAVFAAGLLAPVASIAQENEPEPTVVQVTLGSDKDNEHRFHPDHLTFKSGQLYNLTLVNVSNNVHEIDSPDFTAAVFSKDVVVFDDIAEDAKPIAIVVGGVREIEVQPGGRTEWTFVAIEPGEYEVDCKTDDAKTGKTHMQMGMKATYTIE